MIHSDPTHIHPPILFVLRRAVHLGDLRGALRFPTPLGRASPRPPWAVMMSLSPVGRVLFGNYAIRCLVIQLEHAGGAAYEIVDLVVDAQGRRKD